MGAKDWLFFLVDEESHLIGAIDLKGKEAIVEESGVNHVRLVGRRDDERVVGRDELPRTLRHNAVERDEYRAVRVEDVEFLFAGVVEHLPRLVAYDGLYIQLLAETLEAVDGVEEISFHV